MGDTSGEYLGSFFVISELFHALGRFMSRQRADQRAIISYVFILFVYVGELSVMCVYITLYAVSSLDRGLAIPIIVKVLGVKLLTSLSISSVTT